MGPVRIAARPRYVAAAVALVVLLVVVVLVAAQRDTGEPRPADGPGPAPATDDVPVTAADVDACAPLAERPFTRPGGDLVLTSANVLTMQGTRRSGSVTVRAGLIERVDDTRKPVDGGIDLEGATVLPGLIDSHSHWIGDKHLARNSATQAIDEALAQGWTSISELFVDDVRLNELCALESSGLLRLKVGAFLALNYGPERFPRPFDGFEPGQVLGSTLFLQGVKAFADRADDGLGYQTDPPDPAVQGDVFWAAGDLAMVLDDADRAGWQIAVHATGDGGLDVVLDAFEQLGRAAIVRGRHRVEHLTVVRDDQVDRLADLGLTASVQHSWFHADAEADLTRWVGERRRALVGRWRDLVDAGVPLVGSTDHPWAVGGEAGSSIEAISAAVTGIGPSGAGPAPWLSAQRLSVWEVLRSVTVDAAYARGLENTVGSIEVGKAGDLVILSADPTRVPAAEIAGIEVLATVVDGLVEYCAPSAPEDLRGLCPD